MPPPKQQRQKSAGQASADDQHPGRAAPAARRGTTSKSGRRSSGGKRSDRAKEENAGRNRPASDLQAPEWPGSELPASRTVKPPETQWDFDERQDTRATRDRNSLELNIKWQWHRTAQRLVTYAGIASLTLVFIFLIRKLGLPPQTAANLTIATLASATGGVIVREVLNALTGKRRSPDYRSDDDVSRNASDRSS